MRKWLIFALMAFAFVGCGDDDGNDDVVNKIDLAHFKQILVGTWQTSEEHYGVWGKTIKFSSDGMMNDSVPYSLSVRKSVGEMMGGHGNYYEYDIVEGGTQGVDARYLTVISYYVEAMTVEGSGEGAQGDPGLDD